MTVSDRMDQPELTARQFGATAAKYLTSAVHATGADIERLAEICARSRPARTLDLGSGAGHASFALARGGEARCRRRCASTSRWRPIILSPWIRAGWKRARSGGGVADRRCEDAPHGECGAVA